jgi:hypothetical protein
VFSSPEFFVGYNIGGTKRTSDQQYGEINKLRAMFTYVATRQRTRQIRRHRFDLMMRPDDVDTESASDSLTAAGPCACSD